MRPAVQHHASVAASTPLDLRLHVGARSERVALGGVSVERRGALRWQAGLIVDGDLAGGVRLGLGIAPADGLVLDAIAEVTAGPDGAGWRTGLALGLGQDLRVSLEPAWTDAGPSLSVSLSLALWLRP